MALYAPVALLMLPILWLAVVLTGYAAMYWAVGAASWGRAFAVSGSSLLTLGFISPQRMPSTLLAFSGAHDGAVRAVVLRPLARLDGERLWRAPAKAVATE